MRTSTVYDISNAFITYLEITANRTNPVPAISIEEILDLIERIKREGFSTPPDLTIDETLVKAIMFTNARLPISLRIVYQPAGVFISTVAYLELPVYP